jgi:hypothetical protein
MAFKEPTDTAGLVALAQKVKWPVRQHNQQVTIYPPGDNPPVTVGVRDGDPRGFHNAKVRLYRAGLYDAGVQLQLDRAEVARETVDRERARTEELIEQLNNQAAAAAAAADEGESDMSRINEDLSQLVTRCKAVGWPTRTIGQDKSQVLVTPPGQRPITIACGSGQRHYLTTMIDKLTRAGLLEAEAAQRKQLQDADDITATAPDTTAPEPEPDDDVVEVPEPVTPVPPQGVAAQAGDVPGGITEVRGIKVAEWGLAHTPVGAVDSKATELLLEDGTIVYGCHLGDFTGHTWQSVAKHRRALHPEHLGVAARRRAELAELAADRLAAAPVQQSAPEPAPAAPAPPPPVISLQPDRAAGQEMPQPRRAEAVPPTVRAGISAVAAATPKPAAVPVPPAPAGTMNLNSMVTRMRQLAGVEAERAKLHSELEAIKRELETAKRQGTQLAEQCIAKDREIRRLREKAQADAATVAAAQELQKLMSSLMTGPTVQLAA